MDHAEEELMKQLRQRIPEGTEKVRFGVVHVGAPQVVGPVTTHLGTGAWGVAYVVEDD